MDRFTDDASEGFLATLSRIEPESGADSVTLAEIFGRLDERVYGVLLLILALPCLVPGLPGAQLFAVGILALAVQLLAGRTDPWLPSRILRIKLPTRSVLRVLAFARRRLAWVEHVSKPRAQAFSTGLGERLAGLAVAVGALAVMMPITNTIPSVAITLIAIGLIQRDGLLWLIGSMIAGLWAAGLVAAGWGVATGAGWIAARLPA